MANDPPKEANDPKADGFVERQDVYDQRSAALAACEHATRAGNGQQHDHVRAAIEAFEQSVAGGGKELPSPDGGPRPMYAAFEGNGSWTVGKYLAYDALLPDVDDNKQPRPWTEESTPILLVTPESTDGRVCTLHVERRIGPHLVTPHWGRMRTTEFPGAGKASFFDTVHGILRAALRRSRKACRLTWWLSGYGDWQIPPAIGGSSAEASALCAALAVLKRTDPASSPLLHPRIAVSAQVVARTDKPKKWALASLALAPAKVCKKFRAACAADLLGIVFHVDDLKHLPAKGADDEPTREDAATVARAYDSLLVTSQAVIASKTAACRLWNDRWTPKPTPPDYAQSTPDE